MSDIERFEDLIQDAEDNFHNGRLVDAYNHFNNISQQFFQVNDLANGIYFKYRAIICRSNELTVDNLRDVIQLGVYLIKLAVNWTNKRIHNETNPWKSMKLLEIQKQLISDLDLSSQHKPIEESLVNIYKIVKDEHDLDIQIKTDIFEKLMEINPSDIEIKGEYFSHLLTLTKDISEDEINIYQKLQNYQKLSNLANSNQLGEIEKEINRLSSLID